MAGRGGENLGARGASNGGDTEERRNPPCQDTTGRRSRKEEKNQDEICSTCKECNYRVRESDNGLFCDM